MTNSVLCLLWCCGIAHLASISWSINPIHNGSDSFRVLRSSRLACHAPRARLTGSGAEGQRLTGSGAEGQRLTGNGAEGQRLAGREAEGQGTAATCLASVFGWINTFQLAELQSGQNLMQRNSMGDYYDGYRRMFVAPSPG